MGSKGYPPDIVTFNCFLKINDVDDAFETWWEMDNRGCARDTETAYEDFLQPSHGKTICAKPEAQEHEFKREARLAGQRTIRFVSEKCLACRQRPQLKGASCTIGDLVTPLEEVTLFEDVTSLEEVTLLEEVTPLEEVKRLEEVTPLDEQDAAG
nr:pentatricopeptide repeat-containing protein At1g73400, mitochondrial [Ipomoea batatas]